MSKSTDDMTGAGCALLIAIVAIAVGAGCLLGAGMGFIALGVMFLILVLA
jgi:hypothetical protein